MQFVIHTDIQSKPEDIFPWIAEPDKAMKWQKGIKGGEIIKETSEKTGTTFKEVLEENGKRLEMYGEITDYIPDRLISFQLESKIHKVHVTYSVSGNDSKSIITVECSIHWKFPMNFMCLFLGRNIRKNILTQTESEIDELKKLCEQ